MKYILTFKHRLNGFYLLRIRVIFLILQQGNCAIEQVSRISIENTLQLDY